MTTELSETNPIKDDTLPGRELSTSSSKNSPSF